METVQELERAIPVADTADVVVCGGGPAGVAAAVSAARGGARTTLLEDAGCLGGVWTAGALSHIIDSANKDGIMAEILRRLNERATQLTTVDYDVESMKLILEDLCVQAGVRIRLYTRVVAALTDENKRLTTVVTESKSGREAWRGKMFVDATGDGDLAARAGCGFDMGRESDGGTQPMSLMALLTGVDYSRLEAAGLARQAGKPHFNYQAKMALLKEMRRAGIEPSYGAPTLFVIRRDLYGLMTNHEYGVRCDDADGITGATLHARREINAVVDGLRRLGGPWERMRLIATAEQIGIREGRRIHGQYTLTADDLVRGARFDDAVCRATFCVDVHATDPTKNRGYDDVGYTAKPYDIPMRSLVARDVRGLMMAGRCVSGDFIAHSSYRVTGNAVAMGEAAGRAAADAAAKP